MRFFSDNFATQYCLIRQKYIEKKVTVSIVLFFIMLLFFQNLTVILDIALQI